VKSKKSVAWIVRRACILAILWYVLAEGLMIQWWLGLGVVLLATATNYVLSYEEQNTRALSLRAIVVLLPYFFYQSYRGGVQVAMVALVPKWVVKPYFVQYPLRIRAEDELARLSLAAILCLLPGTVSCRIDENHMLMHVLNEGMYSVADTRKMEELIARAFRIPLRGTEVSG
jgi:multicomponent Na+:H+ antiporter subunit E